MSTRPPNLVSHAHTVGNSLRNSANHSPAGTPVGHQVSKEELNAQLKLLKARLEGTAAAGDAKDGQEAESSDGY